VPRRLDVKPSWAMGHAAAMQPRDNAVFPSESDIYRALDKNFRRIYPTPVVQELAGLLAQGRPRRNRGPLTADEIRTLEYGLLNVARLFIDMAANLDGRPTLAETRKALEIIAKDPRQAGRVGNAAVLAHLDAARLGERGNSPETVDKVIRQLHQPESKDATARLQRWAESALAAYPDLRSGRQSGRRQALREACVEFAGLWHSLGAKPSRKEAGAFPKFVMAALLPTINLAKDTWGLSVAISEDAIANAMRPPRRHAKRRNSEQ